MRLTRREGPTRRDRARRDDRGVTLTEVLVAITLLGVIIVPMSGAVLGFLRNTNETNQRMSESHDAQIAAAYFAQDAQSVGVHDWAVIPYVAKASVETNVAAGGGLYPCGPTGPAGTPTALVRFAWDDPTTATGTPRTVRVSYVVRTVGTERQLRRVVCTQTTATTVDSETVLVHNLNTTDPVVTCADATGTVPACATVPVPQTVTMQLSIRAGSTGDPLTVTLVGQRRQT